MFAVVELCYVRFVMRVSKAKRESSYCIAVIQFWMKENMQYQGRSRYRSCCHKVMLSAWIEHLQASKQASACVIARLRAADAFVLSLPGMWSREQPSLLLLHESDGANERFSVDYTFMPLWSYHTACPIVQPEKGEAHASGASRQDMRNPTCCHSICMNETSISQRLTHVRR
jgi:hypothetical protein